MIEEEMLRELETTAYGHLTVYAVNKETGERTKLVDKKNQITNLHLTNLAELITQKVAVDPAERAHHSMWIESSATALPAPTPADTGPAGSLEKQAVFDRAADVDVDIGGTPGLCEFRAVLEDTEGNGSDIRAAGIYTRGDDDDPSIATGTRLVARQVFDAIPKTSAITLQFNWRIQYTIA